MACFQMTALFFLASLFLGNHFLVMSMKLPSDSVQNGAPPAEGMVVIGDMVIPEDLYRYLNTSPTSRKISVRPQTNWPEVNGVPTVPYSFRFDVLKFREVIVAGMKHWEEHTCIKFTPTLTLFVASIKFINGPGCYSNIGRVSPFFSQAVSIGNGCDTLRTVVHEIGHAIGFLHEQMRPDRDEFLKVNLNNVDPQSRSNFEKFSARDYVNHGVPYDYTSVMQYAAMDFSSNGKLTMATTDPIHQGLLGRGQILSHRDKHVANIQYKCIDKWLKQCFKTRDPCQNNGYLGKNCLCVCPPGTSGNFCQTKTGEYYGSNLPTCSRVITQPTEISSPNYPQKIPTGTWCIYHIKAPEGKVVQLRFANFSIETSGISGPYRCYAAFLELRHQNKHEGVVACGQDIRSNQTFVSLSRDMYLYLDVPYGNNSLGFKAAVTFLNTTKRSL